MADVELLPLVGTLKALPEHVQRVVQTYGHANVAHATAPLQAEIEALRKDAERYRWLRKGVHDDIAVVRGLGAMDSVGGEANTYSKEIDGDDLDAAIDAALAQEDRND